MKVMVDIGAGGYPGGNTGHSRTNDSTQIYLFEPGAAAFKVLQSKYKDTPNYFVSNKAIFNKVGTLDFYLTKKKNCSSLLEPNEKDIFVKDRSDIRTYEIVQVECSTLEQELGHLDQIDYLKLDTQGSEYEILQSAGDLLDRVVEIQCEVEHTEMYKEQKLENDINELLTERGFKQIRKHKVGNHSDVWYINTKYQK